MNPQPLTINKIKLEIEPRFECSICLEHLKDPILTSCGHKFCAACIDSWINVKHKNYCPIDEVKLTKEDIFPDNYTRREILENNLTCPYEQCSHKVSIPDYETHVSSCHLKYSQQNIKSISQDTTDFAPKPIGNLPNFPISKKNNKKLTLTVFPIQFNMQVNSQESFACKYYDAGCREVFKSNELLEKHYDLKTAFHLDLIYNQYKHKMGTQKMVNGNSEIKENLSVVTDPVLATNGDSKIKGSHTECLESTENDSTSQLNASGVQDEYNESLNKSTNLNSSDSSTTDAANSPFTKNQKQIEAYLMKNKEEESKLWDPNKNENGEDGNKSCSSCSDNSNLLKLLYERIVLLEQSKLELEIKVNKLEIEVKQTVEIEDNVTLKLCNGIYYWKLDGFKSKLEEMVQTNRYLYSARFYSSCYGYRFCTRVNISRDDPQYLSLFIHLVQGEHDDILPWPFVGKIRFTALNTSSHLNIQDEIQSDGNFDSFKRPLNFFLNKKAFGFNNFMRISDVVAPNSGYLMEDETLVIRTQVSEL